MAGKKTTAAEPETQGKAIKMPAPKTFLNFHKAATSMRTEIAELTGDLGAASKEAKKKHVDMWSYKALAALEKCSPEKLAERLAKFDAGRELLKLDEKANLQGRLFPTDGDKAAEDAKDDVRPRHLRQPGASAATAVQDIADAAGAKIPPRDPIEDVGRGKPN